MLESQLEPLARERRRRGRVRDRFPAALIGGRPGIGRPLRGIVRDFDSEGLCLETNQPAAVGSEVRVAFKIPRSLNWPFRGMECKLPARVRIVRDSGRPETPYDLVLQWKSPLDQLVKRSTAAHEREVGVILGALIIALLYFNFTTLAYFWYSPFIYVYTVLIALYFLSRFLFASMHTNPVLHDYTPSISIIISVRNEEDAIAKTIDTCFAADYPNDLREVIVVNDGSTDNTAKVLDELTKKYPKLTVRSIPPSGKRDGMATGVRLAKGELIVFVDSDTFLYPDSLRHIVCGFEDRTLGAASGHTEVANAALNVLTGLQEVRYFLSYRLMKASESVFGAVSCCPGCLSAYRKEYVLQVLDAWLHQRFLGAKATFGDDRSLTNYILRDHRVIYNERALSSTLAPETWGRYMRQQVRWKKSWLRETLLAGRFMYKKHPVAALSFYLGAMCSLLSPLMVFRAAVLSFYSPDTILLYYVLGLVLVGLAQCLFFYLVRPSRSWLLGMLLVAVQVVLMGPQTYYAMFTMRKNHWGTRG